jgi:hypothetical protein
MARGRTSFMPFGYEEEDDLYAQADALAALDVIQLSRAPALGSARGRRRRRGGGGLRVAADSGARGRAVNGSQRAMVPAKIATLPQGLRVDRQPCRSTPMTQTKAAQILNVSERTVVIRRSARLRCQPNPPLPSGLSAWAEGRRRKAGSSGWQGSS